LRLFASLCLLVIFNCNLSAQTLPGKAESDNQFWNETQLVVWSNEKNEIALNGVLRVGRNFSYPTDNRIGFSFSHKPSKYLTLTGGYLYRAAFPSKTRKTFENRLIGSFTLNAPLKSKFKLSDRNQFEYKSINSRPNTWDYRNRLRTDREITVGKTKITPFGFVEAFYNEKNNWYRSRFAFGIHKKLTKKVTGELFYLRQNDGISRPGNLNILGTYLKIEL
jgi:Protein of unknown function (DUF2490)